ncbi:MAG: potassium efflux system protein [Verrucomicrobiales bacterium]|jgi:potassium efflux system protein
MYKAAPVKHEVMRNRTKIRSHWHRLLFAGLLGISSVWGQSKLLMGDSKTPLQVVEAPQVTYSNVIKQVQRELVELHADSTNAVPAEITQKLDKLKQIQKLAEECQGVLRTLETKLDARVIDLPDLDQLPPPWSVLEVDKVRTLQRGRKATQLKYQEILQTAVQETDYAKKQLLVRKQELRALKELSQPSAEQKKQIDQLPYEIRLLEQTAELQQLRLRVARRESEHLATEIQQIDLLRDRLRRKIAFNSSSYQDVLVKHDEREANLNRQREKYSLLLRVEEASVPTPERLESIRVLRRQGDAIAERLERLPEDRAAWQRRYSLFNEKIPLSTRLTWETEAKQYISRLERLLRVKQIRVEDLRVQARAASVDQGVAEVVDPPDELIAKSVDEIIASLLRSYDLQQNLLADLILKSASAPMNAVWTRTKDVAHKAWFFEITSIDDRPVTVRKILLAILILIVGLRIARWLAYRMVRAGLAKAKVDDNSIIAVTTLLNYGLAVLVFVIALGSAGIPLTLFALLGGALAIGLGFGSQNIINNFISGLILLIERPIRVGDMVDVSGTYGKIIRVGLRCTQVRTFNNVDILVPNSQFLETNVVNWTLTDDRTRGELFIGMAYGTPTSRVKAIMLKVAKEHPKIMKDPAPEVMFMDFADNALIFRLYIWVHMRSPSDRDRVLSDLRFQVDELFQQEGLVIAFPQRDVHLDTLKPLEVRLVKEDPAE